MPDSASTTTTPSTRRASNTTDPAAHLGELTRTISADVIDAALDTANGHHRRHRGLPSHIVIYLILAAVLFAEQGWRSVFARLTAGFSALTGPLAPPAASSITAAMRRVGTEPLDRLFLLLAGPAVTSTHRDTPATGDGEFFAGLRVVAIDGTQMAIADTPANLVEYPKPAAGPNGAAGHPMLQLLTLVTCGTRHVLDAVFGPDTRSELSYADDLTTPGRVDTVPSAMGPGMLVLADRNFATRGLMRRTRTTCAEFLMRMNTGTRALKLPVDESLSDGSYLSRLTCPMTGEVTVVRVIDATVTTTTAAGSAGNDYRLVTSLTDPACATAEELVDLYHRRWAIETSFLEAKQMLLDGRVLRGRYPAAVSQEVWAVLVAYQALRTVMAEVVLGEQDTPVDRLSFTVAVRAARDQVVLYSAVWIALGFVETSVPVFRRRLPS